MSDSPPDRTPPKLQSPSYQTRCESRFGTDELHCSLGRIADITGSGMRMIVKPEDLPEIGDIQSYTFADEQHELTVTGTVKWVRKATLFTRRGEVGVEFTKLDPQTRQAIIRLAVHGEMGLAKDKDIQVAYPDLYKILGSSRYASKEELQISYRKETKAWHPDANDHPQAAQYFEEIQKAYAVLSDEQARAKYDLRFFGPELDPENTFGDQPDDQPGEQAA